MWRALRGTDYRSVMGKSMLAKAARVLCEMKIISSSHFFNPKLYPKNIELM